MKTESQKPASKRQALTTILKVITAIQGLGIAIAVIAGAIAFLTAAVLGIILAAGILLIRIGLGNS